MNLADTNGNTITLTTTVIRSPEQMHGCIDAQAVLLSVANGKYYSMNPLGTRIWDHIQAPLRVDALIKNLLDEFEVDPRVCESEVLQFLGRLQVERLVEVQT